MADYPTRLVRKGRLLDGTEVTVRPIRPEDVPLEQDFVRHLSDDARYNRFMAELRELSPGKLKHLTEIDYERQMAFVATVARQGKEVEIGVARYASDAIGDNCEFAVVVDDACRGTGLAELLMRALMEAARSHGFKTMEGLVLANNHRMLNFARRLGFEVKREANMGDTVIVARKL